MLTLTYVLSQIFVVISYALLAWTYGIKNRKFLLIVSFASLIANGVAYLLLGAYSGLAMVGLAMVRNIIFMIQNKFSKRNGTTYIDWLVLLFLVLASVGLSIWTYNGFLSLFSIFATLVYTVAIWQKNKKVYDYLGILSSVLWIIYNSFVKSIFGIILESVLLIVIVAQIVISRRGEKMKPVAEKTKAEDLEFKKIEEKDKDQLFALIDTVLGGLEDKSHFIPYEKWELDSMFDEKNYAPLVGAYDGDKLVGMAQLYVSQKMMADFKKDFGIDERYFVCELGGNLVLPEYRGLGITTTLQIMLFDKAKDLGFDYIISMAHPDNVASQKTLEKVGLEFVKTTTVAGGFRRKLYMKKLK